MKIQLLRLFTLFVALLGAIPAWASEKEQPKKPTFTWPSRYQQKSDSDTTQSETKEKSESTSSSSSSSEQQLPTIKKHSINLPEKDLKELAALATIATQEQKDVNFVYALSQARWFENDKMHYLEQAKFWLSVGANIHATDTDNKSPLNLSILSNFNTTDRAKKQLEWVRFVCKHKEFNPNLIVDETTERTLLMQLMVAHRSTGWSSSDKEKELRQYSQHKIQLLAFTPGLDFKQTCLSRYNTFNWALHSRDITIIHTMIAAGAKLDGEKTTQQMAVMHFSDPQLCALIRYITAIEQGKKPTYDDNGWTEFIEKLSNTSSLIAQRTMKPARKGNIFTQLRNRETHKNTTHANKKLNS